MPLHSHLYTRTHIPDHVENIITIFFSTFVQHEIIENFYEEIFYWHFAIHQFHSFILILVFAAKTIFVSKQKHLQFTMVPLITLEYYSFDFFSQKF